MRMAWSSNKQQKKTKIKNNYTFSALYQVLHSVMDWWEWHGAQINNRRRQKLRTTTLSLPYTKYWILWWTDENGMELKWTTEGTAELLKKQNEELLFLYLIPSIEFCDGLMRMAWSSNEQRKEQLNYWRNKMKNYSFSTLYQVLNSVMDWWEWHGTQINTELSKRQIDVITLKEQRLRCQRNP